MNPSRSSSPATDAAERLNRECQCVSVDHSRLEAYLDADTAQTGLYRLIRETRPYLFSDMTVFSSRAQIERMAEAIAAIESVVRLDAWHEAVLAWAGPCARVPTPTRGVFLCYDFHLTADGPRLIEINTNGGGGFLIAMLARAQRACCPETAQMVTGPIDPARLEAAYVEMFRAEWRAARGGQPLETIAIVDDAPQEQYLYPEFLLAAECLRRAGYKVVIADASELLLCHGRLYHEETPIDLVYNRLTDFSLSETRHTLIRQAWLQQDGATVITPHPRAHALYADKRNLVLLSDPDRLRALGASETAIACLQRTVPRTVPVTAETRDELWRNRKQLFFKPASGFGSRAAYRGDKLTKRVWEEICLAEYVAQEIAPPGERHVRRGEAVDALKFDLRCFVYNGEVQFVAARLYQGQTTNFRTVGGGFAPVFYPPTPGT